ncbi:MAG TPA: phospholipid carrier-dependent glycosyltransferase [Flavobacteriaceae bacterium]|jgi:4-amino-4-deoxy-L-arabinose transferase-like glycosyltransferase|nr:phospholipid carrier-dependent glycosyltransferase [Flavobacteriaceae bacterium]
MITPIKSFCYTHRYALVFWALVILRMLFNAVLPLMDKTEARYGEIARIMSETGNWITPQIDYGIPFWAKPPLSTWASAGSISIFGSAEFFVRLPYLIVVVLLALFISKYRTNPQQAYYLPGIIFISLPEVYLHAGVVSTDTFLTLSIAMTMLGFWEAMQEHSKRYWGYLFFAGLGIGLLAKGPIVGVLTLPPLGIWVLLTKNFKKVFSKLPWFSGTALTLLISLPWYGMAEVKTPGFLDYFLVGEHFERYFNSEWKGDKYGFPKQQPMGIAWLFLVAFLVPWSIAMFHLVLRKGKSFIQQPWLLFLSLWALWTPFFFTTSKSLIHPYILPSCLPIALGIVYYWQDLRYKKTYTSIALGLPLLLLAIYLSGFAKPLYENTTDKYLIEAATEDLPWYALEKKTYSSQFYSKGKVALLTREEFLEKITLKTAFFIFMTKTQWEALDPEIQSQFSLYRDNKKRGVYRYSPK